MSLAKYMMAKAFGCHRSKGSSYLHGSFASGFRRHCCCQKHDGGNFQACERAPYSHIPRQFVAIAAHEPYLSIDTTSGERRAISSGSLSEWTDLCILGSMIASGLCFESCQKRLSRLLVSLFFCVPPDERCLSSLSAVREVENQPVSPSYERGTVLSYTRIKELDLG